MVCCAAVNCYERKPNKGDKGKGIIESEGNGSQPLIFHRFPNGKRDQNLLTKWIEAVQEPGWVPKKNSVVCSKHFKDDDYVKDARTSPTTRKLKANAVPSHNVPLNQRNNFTETNSQAPGLKILKWEKEKNGTKFTNSYIYDTSAVKQKSSDYEDHCYAKSSTTNKENYKISPTEPPPLRFFPEVKKTYFVRKRCSVNTFENLNNSESGCQGTINLEDINDKNLSIEIRVKGVEDDFHVLKEKIPTDGTLTVCCRLCNEVLIPKNGQLLYDENGADTTLGKKLKIVLHLPETKSTLSRYCCNPCALKIQSCFCLLIEIQAADQIVKQTYQQMTKTNFSVPGTQYFYCSQCKQNICGTRLFVKHFEKHLLSSSFSNQKSLETSGGPDVEFLSDDESPDKNISLTATVDGKPFTLNFPSSAETNNFQLVSAGNNSVFEGDTDVGIISDQQPYHRVGLPDHVLTQDLLDLLNEKEDVNIAAGIGGSNLEDDDDDNEEGHVEFVKIIKRELNRIDDEPGGEQKHFRFEKNLDDEYICQYCRTTFKFKFLLVRHLVRRHKDRKVVAKQVKRNKELHIICRYCQTGIDPKLFRTHVVPCKKAFFAQGTKVMCHFCGKLVDGLKWHGHRGKHYQDGREYFCGICNRKFKRKTTIKNHMAAHDESIKKICEICGKKFSPAALRIHLQKHAEKKQVCHICGKKFTFNYTLQDHLKTHERSAKRGRPAGYPNKTDCASCKVTFETPQDLFRHQKEQHNKYVPEFLECELCGKSCRDMFDVKTHLKVIHKLSKEELCKYKSFPVYKEVQCTVCEKLLTSERQLELHMRKEHDMKPADIECLKRECELCGKRFSTKQILSSHIDSEHLKIKSINCEYCDQKFSKYSIFVIHRMKHTGEKPYQCTYCKKSYRQTCDVFRHLSRHVRDGDISMEEATAVNTSSSKWVKKKILYLKDSNLRHYANTKHTRKRKITDGGAFATDGKVPRIVASNTETDEEYDGEEYEEVDEEQTFKEECEEEVYEEQTFKEEVVEEDEDEDGEDRNYVEEYLETVEYVEDKNAVSFFVNGMVKKFV